MNTLKQQLPFIKKAFVFLLGSWIFAYGTASVVTIFWLESFQNISVEGIRSYFQDPFPSIFVSALKMYVIVYILFYTLPDKIQNAKFWLRGIYFLLFYVFCCLTYFWIYDASPRKRAFLTRGNFSQPFENFRFAQSRIQCGKINSPIPEAGS